MTISYPHAVLEKLVEDCGVAFLRLAMLPEPGSDGAIRSVKSEFTDPKPVVLRADHVFYVGASNPYTLVAEIQLHIDEEKPAAWTGYLAFLFRKYECPAEIVVLTNSREVEAWARKPIAVSSWKQGELKESEFKDFLDTMLTAVTASWRREIMESNIQTRTFLEELEAQAKERGIEQGIEQGIGRGKEEGLRESIKVVCRNRGLILSPSLDAQLNACHDHNTLKRWLELAMSATSSEDVFA